jgi:hypothetical protein
LAEQWFKEGDVPEAKIKYMEDEKGKCRLCEKPMHLHGICINSDGSEEIFCPGDWVIRTPEGNFQSMSNELFHRKYAPVEGS